MHCNLVSQEHAIPCLVINLTSKSYRKSEQMVNIFQIFKVLPFNEIYTFSYGSHIGWRVEGITYNFKREDFYNKKCISSINQLKEKIYGIHEAAVLFWAQHWSIDHLEWHTGLLDTILKVDYLSSDKVGLIRFSSSK